MSKLTPFGIAIRKLRLDKGLRLIDMAEKLDMSTAFLSAIETGRKPIPDGLVRKISRAFTWPKEELSLLTRAVDQTRKDVRIADDKKEEDRELIAVFARKLDQVPTATIEQLKKLFELKSIEGETPFSRRRRGIVVPPVSTKAIREYAEKVRNAFVVEDQIVFPIIPVLEFGICKMVDPSFIFEVWEQEDMGDDEGRVPVGGNELILRRDVYEGACRNNKRDRFTASHELGHYLMHRKITLARASSHEDKIYTDSEWQADEFAGTLLMSPRHAPSFGSSDDMADACQASQQAASVMWSKYIKEGVVSASPSFPGF